MSTLIKEICDGHSHRIKDEVKQLGVDPESMRSNDISLVLSHVLGFVESIKTIVYVDNEDTAPGYETLNSVKASIKDAISYFDKRDNEQAAYWGIFR